MRQLTTLDAQFLAVESARTYGHVGSLAVWSPRSPRARPLQLLGRTRPPVNLVISNVPGPRNPLFLAGAQLQATYPVSVIVDCVGLNITVMSYRDHLDLGIVADRDQVDDVWAILDDVRAALQEFETAVGIEPASGSSDASEAHRVVP